MVPTPYLEPKLVHETQADVYLSPLMCESILVDHRVSRRMDANP